MTNQKKKQQQKQNKQQQHQKPQKKFTKSKIFIYIKKKTPSISLNDFSHVVYLFPHQKLLSTIYLYYRNYVIY